MNLYVLILTRKDSLGAFRTDTFTYLPDEDALKAHVAGKSLRYWYGADPVYVLRVYLGETRSTEQLTWTQMEELGLRPKLWTKNI